MLRKDKNTSYVKPYLKFIGAKFGRLTVLEFTPGIYSNGKNIRAKAKCECDCGIIKWIDWGHLKKSKINSCGCIRDPSVEIGQKFANFVVLEIFPHHYDENGKRILTRVKCECCCGTVKTLNLGTLQAGGTISCGCIGREISKTASIKHGLAYNPIYKLWNGINTRCYNKKIKGYQWYGGMGITNFWKDDVIAFAKYIFTELGPRPSKKHSLDRIDNNKNYEPGNLRWATYKEQAANRTKAHQRKIETLEDQLVKNNETHVKFENLEKRIIHLESKIKDLTNELKINAK